MSKNKIGIEVQVQFPTVKELQNMLAEKWAKVKNGFEGKINVSADENSIKKIRKQIETVLEGKEVKVRLDADTSEAMATINNFYKELKKLDDKLGKNRELKIDIKALDFEKSFREVLADVQKIDNVIGSQTQGLKAQNRELDVQAGKMSKLQQIQKTLKDGTIATTYKTTVKGDMGREEVTTLKPDGRVDTTTTDNRLQALKEIEAVYKRIHKIELEQVGVSGEHYKLLEQERQVQVEQLKLLGDQYQEKYKINSLDDNSVQELKRQQDVNLELKTTLALKQEQAKEEKEIADAIARVAQLEKQKQQLQKQAVSALESEESALREQYDHYNNIQSAIREKYNLQERMTSQQKEELNNIQSIGYIERERIRAKQEQQELQQKIAQEEREQQQREQVATQEILSSLRQVHQLELQIQAIQNLQASAKRNATQAEQDKLQILEKELQLAKDIKAQTEQYHRMQGGISSSLDEQVAKQQKVYDNESKRVAELSKVQGMQEGVNAQIKEYEDVTRQIGQLQRDLIFSGMREQAVLEGQIDVLRTKQNSIRDNLASQKLLTDAVQQEITAIQKAQQEQLQLNRLRQDARERDQAFNDTGGLVDPWAFSANAQQGAMAVFEPIKRLDEAMVGVTKVADGTEEQMAEFAQTSYDAGSKLGVTSDLYIEAVERWVTAGKSFAESQELAKVAMTGAFVGNIAPDDMVKFMSVPLNAFEKEGLKATDVINVMNETANNHAIEMTDLGKAYVRSATTAKNAGISFGELTGMITGAQEATRKGGERIGTGIKTIGINIQSIQSQFKKIDKTNFDYLSGLGMELMNKDGSAKTATEVIGELVKVQDKLKPEEFSNAVKALAGKEHAEVLSAIVDQWERVSQVDVESGLQMGLGDAGSAYAEHAKQADSVKFKLAELKNAWDELMVTIGGGGKGAGGIMDALINGLQQLNNLAKNEELMRVLKFILAGVAIHAGANLWRRFFDTVGQGFLGMITKMKEVKSLSKELSPFGSGGNNVARVGGGRVGDNDSNTKGGNTIVTGSVGSRMDRKNPKSNDDADSIKRAGEGVDEVNGKIGKTWGLVKNLAGFLPIVGDALLVLEFAGVPVFDSIGKAVDGLLGKTKTQHEEFEKLWKDFQKNNDIINGTLGSAENSLGTMKTNLDTMLGQDKNADLKGTQSYLNMEEYEAFTKQFNDLSASLGHKEIKITMNDTEHIKQKILELEDAMSRLGAKATFDIGERLAKDVNKLDGAKDKIKELKKEIDTLTSRKGDLETALKDTMDENGMIKAGHLEAYNILKGAIGDTNDKLKDAKKEFKTAEKAVDDHTTAVKANVKTLFDQGKNLDENNIRFEDTKEALPVMIKEYKKLVDNQGNYAKIQDVINGKLTVTQAEWEKMTKNTIPEYTNASMEQVKTDKTLQGEIGKTAKKAKEAGDAQVKKAEEATLAVGKLAGKHKSTQAEIDKTKNKTGEAGKKVDEFGNKVKNIPSGKKTKIDVEVTGKTWFQKVLDFFGGATSKNLTANITGWFKGLKKDGYVSTGTASKGASRGVTSKSVSSASVGGALIKSPTTVDNATSSKSKAPVNNSTVGSDIWRYWGHETNSMMPIQQALAGLTDELKKAKDNQTQLIKVYEKQVALLKQQMASSRTMMNLKDSEMNSVLGSLKKYGFNVNTSTNQISNLGHAKNLKGVKAEEAEKLLNTWKSLYSEINGLKSTLSDIDNQISDTNDKIKEAKIAKELQTYETQLKRIDTLLKSIGNSNDISDKRVSLVSGSDSELALFENETALSNAKTGMTSLITEFNKLSTATIGYAENGTALQSRLEQLGNSILSQADAVMKYQQAINDLEISRVTKDLSEFNNAVSENNGRIDNNIKNVKEGLLSGTGIGDLKSSSSQKLDLDRDNRYEALAQERINLEKEVQDALAGFAKKNVDRASGVANATLDINSKMYNQLLTMYKDYTAGKTVSSQAIVSEFGSDLSSIGELDKDYKFVKELDDFFSEVNDKQDKLTKDYQAKMSKVTSQSAKDALTNQYIVDSLGVQQEYYEATIKANQEAIKELQTQLKDSTLTDEQEAQIQQSISDYEKGIIDAQNNIKSTIQERFEFEFSLIEEAVKKYDKYASELEYAMSILDAVGGDNTSAKGVLMGEMYELEKSRNAEINASIEGLKKQQSLYEEGSFEWNTINEEVESYNNLLKDSNKTLLEMNRNIMSNSFTGTVGKIEKELFDGKTMEQFDRNRELWLEGIEKEIALENTYQRLADLGTKIHDEKMAQLAKQEKLSKFEMEYLNKQLDVLELQQKLENLNKEKTVQTLKQQADGTWDWSYEANAEQISQTEKEIAQKQLELQQAEEKAQKDYLTKLNEILKSAESGNFESIEDFQEAIDELGEAFDSIVGDFPEIKEDYLKELVDAYSKYVTENGGILEGIGSNITSPNTALFEGFSKEIVKAFDDISTDIGEAIADALISKLPNLSTPTPKAKEDKSISITLENLEFPNVKSADGLKDAILSLPQIALQESKKKL